MLCHCKKSSVILLFFLVLLCADNALAHGWRGIDISKLLGFLIALPVSIGLFVFLGISLFLQRREEPSQKVKVYAIVALVLCGLMTLGGSGFFFYITFPFKKLDTANLLLVAMGLEILILGAVTLLFSYRLFLRNSQPSMDSAS